MGNTPNSARQTCDQRKQAKDQLIQETRASTRAPGTRTVPGPDDASIRGRSYRPGDPRTRTDGHAGRRGCSALRGETSGCLQNAAAQPHRPSRDCRGGAPHSGTGGGSVKATSVRSVRCPCHACPGEPCTPEGDHLARYLRAESAGAISRDYLKAVIAGLDVLAPHVVVRLARATARRASRRGARPTVSDPARRRASEGTRPA